MYASVSTIYFAILGFFWKGQEAPGRGQNPKDGNAHVPVQQLAASETCVTIVKDEILCPG